MLIFDFDGVLISSIDEVAVTAYNAATRSLCTALAEVPADIIEMFKNNRFHVQPIGDAVTLMDWCIQNRTGGSSKILDEEEYRAIVEKAEPALTDRTNLIYDTRRRFIEKDVERWHALHRTYQPLWDGLIRYKDRPYVILANKNHEATLRLCRHFGLDIDAEDIYSGDSGVTKIANMLQIRARFDGETYFFIDDSLKNLKELDHRFNQAKQLLSLALASWGYIGAQDADEAAACGYPVYRQTDMLAMLSLPD